MRIRILQKWKAAIVVAVAVAAVIARLEVDDH
jgi:hypothetical protein